MQLGLAFAAELVKQIAAIANAMPLSILIHVNRILLRSIVFLFVVGSSSASCQRT
jgi:hypothetical protein